MSRGRNGGSGAATVAPSQDDGGVGAAAWGLPRSTYYARRHRLNHPVELHKRGPRTAWTDEVLTRADPRADRRLAL